MLTIGYGCGLRGGEVTRLKVRDIDNAQGIIRRVAGKISIFAAQWMAFALDPTSAPR
jgi:integrase